MAKIDLVILEIGILDFDSSQSLEIEVQLQTVADLGSLVASCSKSCLLGLRFELFKAS